MNAQDWLYAGEGGAHVIFSYRRSAERQDDALHETNLLRLVKQELAWCSIQNGETDQVDDASNHLLVVCADGSAPRDNDTQDELAYLRLVVAPFLRPFMDVPKLVLVHPKLASDLYRQAWDSGKIPSHRQASWCCVTETTTLPRRTMLRGLLLRDYRMPGNNITITTSSALTVEIKPKAGYTAVSPLVDPDRRAKYHFCRYQLLHGHEETSYNPLNLFSREATRIRQSLQALMERPRNNFRLWLASSNARIQELPTDCKGVNRFLQAWMDGSTLDTMMDMVTQILLAEDSFLLTIQALQRLDVIDSDGAVRIYDRLVNHWLHGSHEQAWQLLDVTPKEEWIQSCTVQLHNRLGSCPPALLADLPTPSQVLEEYLALVERSEKHLSPQQPSDESTIDSIHQQALALVQRMNQNDCLILLRLWLLSLAMCDLSFFVRLHFIHHDQTTGTFEQNETVQVKQKQTTDTPGVLLYWHNGRRIDVAYEIKVIDCDRKPAKKLKSRQEKEDATFSKLQML